MCIRDSGKFGQYFPPEEFRRLTFEINRRPVERSTKYDYLKVFEDDFKAAENN